MNSVIELDLLLELWLLRALGRALVVSTLKTSECFVILVKPYSKHACLSCNFFTACAVICAEVATLDATGGVGFDLSGGGNLVDKALDAENSFTTTWSYSTSTDPSLAGSQSDVFVVPNLSVAFNEVLEIFWDDNTCKVIYEEDGKLPKKIEFDVESDDSKPAFSFFSRYYIETGRIHCDFVL